MQPKSQWGFLFRDLFSGRDNYSLDIGRILWALGVVVYLGLSVASAFMDLKFDYITWGAGFAAVLAAGGAALKMKESTEPNKVLKDKPPEET